jgi:hypothetical protein
MPGKIPGLKLYRREFAMKRIQFRFFGLVAICIVFDLFAMTTSSVAGETIFRFNPPDATAFTLSIKTTKSTSMGPMMGRSEDGELVTKYTISRTADGYRMTGNSVSHTMIRDGNKTENPVMALLKDVPITTNMDKNGRAVSVTGYDKFIEKMNENLPPEAVKQMAPMFNEESMSKNVMTEWNGRIGNLVGRSCLVGETWIVSDEIEMPGRSPMIFYTALKITENVNIKGHDCVKVEFEYNSDPAGLAEFSGKTVGEIEVESGVESVTQDATMGSVTGKGERVIDPATMLVYSEKMTRTLKMEMQMMAQGQQQKMEMIADEKREYIYDYE